MQKLEKLVDALIFLAEEGGRYYQALNGRADGIAPEMPALAPAVEQPAAKPPRSRKPKAFVAETAQAGPFDALEAGKPAATQPAPKLSVEDAAEASRKGLEVLGLYVRRFIRAKPSGVERAKEIIVRELGPRNGDKPWAPENFKPEDWQKLTPIFEAELEKAEAAA